ncbi:MAG TPA: C39 family peptidase [Pseudonocardiaceae bacterium]
MRISRAARAAAVASTVLVLMLVEPATGGARSGAAAFDELHGDLGGAWPTDFHAWSTHRDFTRGTVEGLQVLRGRDAAVTLAPGTTTGSWTSGWYTPPDAFTQLVPSWHSNTPAGTWVEIGLQVRTATTESMWFNLGRWASDTSAIERSSMDGQGDPVGRVFTDTFVARAAPPGGTPVGYRLRATLHGTGTAAPVVRQLAATSAAPGPLPEVSQPLSRRPVELGVPPYSQSIHSGEYPQFGGGGGVWCSPTSTAMVLSYWRTGPTAEDLAALPPDPVFDRNGRADGQVAWAAINTWDYVYEGAGNWPFNTAYASEYGLDGSVRQFSTLRAVESWVRRGVPVVTSINWNNNDTDPLNDLDGSSITSTDGHLMLVIGFTADGDVIANDPASPSNADVRHIYRRDQFERNWLRASDGTTYIIKPHRITG